MNWSFHNPVKVSLLERSSFIERLTNFSSGKRVGLLVSERAVREYCLEEAIDTLRGRCDLVLIQNIPSNPTFESIHQGLQFVGVAKPQALVAIGGGSTIDTAKAMSTMASYEAWPPPLESLYEAVKTKPYRNLTSGIPIMAVPTTAGSGSDLTMWGTVWDAVNKQKYSVEAPWLYPEESWIVPEFTASMSPRLTLSTGLDALCQATEAWWSVRSNPIIRRLSASAISLITKYLPEVLANPSDLDSRRHMCLGALFSGLAFSNTRTTACHGLSYPLTAHFGIEHGFAVCMTLPAVMRINWPMVQEQDLLLAAWGADSVDAVSTWLDQVSDPVQPLRLSSFGVSAQDAAKVFESDSLVKERMGNNPVEIDLTSIRIIMRIIEKPTDLACF